MLSFELNKLAKKLLNEIKEAEHFTDAVAALSEAFDPIFPHLITIAEGNAQNGQALALLHRHFNQVSAVTSNITPSKFYKSLHNVQSALKSFLSSEFSDKSIITSLLQSIDNFASLYDTYLTAPSGKNAVHLLRESHLLNTSIANLNKFLNFIIDSLEETSPIEKQYETLSLLLSSNFSLHDFAERLLAIDKLYNELCKIFSICQIEQPIKISKIESGSFWAQIHGNSIIISFMIESIRASATFLYRSYTSEGKIASIPKQVEALDAVISLSNRMKILGLETENMDKFNIQSSAAIAKNLNTLLEKQPSISINNEVLSVGKDHTRYLAESKSPYLLKESQETNDINSPHEQNDVNEEN